MPESISFRAHDPRAAGFAPFKDKSTAISRLATDRADHDAASRSRQRAVLDRIRGELMRDQAKGDRRPRHDGDVQALDRDLVGGCFDIRRQLRHEDRAQLQ